MPLSSRLEYPVDVGKRYDVGLCSVTEGDELFVLINPLDNAGDGFILAFHLISVVFFVGAYDEIFDRHADHVCPRQL